MNKKSLLLLLLPLSLTSCGNNYVPLERILSERIININPTTEHPYYKVQGSLDFNNEVIYVDAVFDKMPTGNSYVPYARYNEGFYVARAGDNIVDEDQVVIYGMASRSYWLRAPIKIDKENFLVYLEDGEENPTCAHYFLEHLITSWIDEEGSANPSSCWTYYEPLSDGGFAIGGNKVHTKFKIDNYPCYPDPEAHPDMFGPDVWDFEMRPRPCYESIVDSKVNVRFEYNKDGWLTKESLSTIDYDYSQSVAGQVALNAVYTYKFKDAA